jgi:hypothetical protein
MSQQTLIYRPASHSFLLAVRKANVSPESSGLSVSPMNGQSSLEKFEEGTYIHEQPLAF